MKGGRRPDEIAAEIMRSGEVTASRATLIARTECARVSSLLTQTRAEGIGATNYIWRTSKDRAVRHSHARMEGKVCDFANPPTLSDGTTTHPGQIYNCRCTMQVILPAL
jgi:phage putative head morphogenesis protein, SPP1 gp7 family